MFFYLKKTIRHHSSHPPTRPSVYKISGTKTGNLPQNFEIKKLPFSEEPNYNVWSEWVSKTWVQTELSIGWFAAERLQ